MGDHDDDPALIGDGTELGEDLLGDHAVQAGVRLVQHEKLRGGHQLHGDGDAPQLTAGFFTDQAAGAGAQAQQIHDLLHPFLPLGSGDGAWQAQLGGVVHRLQHRVVAAHQVLLGHKADLILHMGVILVDIRAVESHLGLGLFIADDGVHQGGLAGAGAAQQQHQGAVGDVQGDILQKVAGLAEVLCRALKQVHAEARFGGRTEVDALCAGDLRRGGAGLPVLGLWQLDGLEPLPEANNEQHQPVEQEPDQDPALLHAKDPHEPHIKAQPVDHQQNEEDQGRQAHEKAELFRFNSLKRISEHKGKHFHGANQESFTGELDALSQGGEAQTGDPGHPALLPFQFAKHRPKAQGEEKDVQKLPVNALEDI